MVRPGNMGFVDADRVLHDRIVASTDRIIKMMPAAAKAAAISSIDVPSLVFHLALGIPAVETDNPEAAERITNAIAFKRRMIDAAGGALTAERVRTLLGHKTIQAVYKAVKDRRLLMVEDNGTKLFPVFQFDGNAILPGIAKVLSAAPHTTGWAILQFLIGGDEGLDGMSPIELLKGSDAEVERIVRFARALED
ncbi:hypothetical protein NOLU111490_12815 [Novosphingobium lubricantis]|nr:MULTISPECIES: hypothetical protein [Sphingomonadaceae]